MAPLLPPRTSSQASSIPSVTGHSPSSPLPRHNTVHLTPQTNNSHPYSDHFGLNDPRSSSTQSLLPSEPAGPDRRTLLIIYIHGFLGDETSFRSFPAHVHKILATALSASHVVHSKLYPRYQSRKNISFARDAFSNWLTPHESDKTDVVLIGHSLGGILAAEVVLIPSHRPGSQDALQHQILGLIAYDTPFLGMHPGVISTGIASLFKGAPDLPESFIAAQEASSSTGPQPPRLDSDDPNFNPSFTNDVHLPVRTNKWERAWYFWNKHYGDLRNATQSYVKSHLEFGGCLADYPGLRRRYDSVRSLEDVDDLKVARNNEGRLVHRVRFVNYYTASTGRIREDKPSDQQGYLTTQTEMQNLKSTPSENHSHKPSNVSTPRPSMEERRDEHPDSLINGTDELTLDQTDVEADALQTLDPQPYEATAEVEGTITPTHDDLPPIPSNPIPPPTFDPSQFASPDALRLAQKENERSIKNYEKAKKDHQKAIRDREKVIAKREKQVRKEQEKLAKLAKQEEKRREEATVQRQSTLNPEHQEQQMRTEQQQQQQQSSTAMKIRKDRKFCSLPAKDAQGRRDQTWIRVYMEGMDEVVAHTSLFFISEAYAKLVGDTADRIEQWVNEDATVRLLRSEVD